MEHKRSGGGVTGKIARRNIIIGGLLVVIAVLVVANISRVEPEQVANCGSGGCPARTCPAEQKGVETEIIVESYPVVLTEETVRYACPAEGGGEGGIIDDEPAPPVVVLPEYTIKESDDSVFLGVNVDRSRIETITFKMDLDVPDNVIETYDVGVEPNTVTMWLDSGDNLTIGTEGRLKANPDSSYLFAFFGNLREINGLNNLNTEDVTNMSFMFTAANMLTALDLSGFDTSDVEIMDDMFGGLSGLTSLDLSGFDTSKVTSMYSMFYGVSSVENLDLSNFDTTNVTTMNSMFYGTTRLKTLDLSGFDTSGVTDMSSMFRQTLSLESLDFSGATFDAVVSYTGMFMGAKREATVYVGDDEAKNWLQGKYATGDFVVAP